MSQSGISEEDGVVFKKIEVISDDDPPFHILPGPSKTKRIKSTHRVNKRTNPRCSGIKNKPTIPKEDEIFFQNVNSEVAEMPAVSNVNEQSFYETETLFSNDLNLYIFQLRENRAISPVDESYLAFIIQDMKGASLVDKYEIVTRRSIKSENGIGWIYGCTCNSIRVEMIDSLAQTLSSSTIEDITVLHPECLHVQAAKQLLLNFDQKESITPQAEFEKNMNHEEEHCYLPQKETQMNIFGNNVDETVMVVQTCQSTKKEYSQVRIVSDRSASNLQCFNKSCVKNKNCCEHVQAVKLSSDEATMAVKQLLDRSAKYRKRYIPKSLSTLQIPFSVKPEEMKKNRQVDQAGEFQPNEHGTCSSCGSYWSDTVQPDATQHDTTWLFTRTSILQIKVFYRECSNADCRERKEYDGAEDQILNMGPYLITHQVFRDFLRQYVTEGTPLISYYKEWYWRQIESGYLDFREKLSFYRFSAAWYCFLDLLDIDYEQGFKCPECGEEPNMIVMDGVTVGLRKSFLPWKHFLETPTSSQREGSHKNRVFLNSTAARTFLRRYAAKDGSDSLSTTEFDNFKTLTNSCQPQFLRLLFEFEDMGFTANCPREYKDLLGILSKNYPVCGFLHYDDETFDIIRKIAHGYPFNKSAHTIEILQKNAPIILKLLNNINGVSKGLSGLLLTVITMAEKPFINKEQTEDGDIMDTSFNQLGLFPGLALKGNRGNYVQDKNSTNQVESCAKKGRSHPSLSPGLFTLSCVHGVCYGFQVMENAESLNIPFTIMKTRFRKAPDIIIYDNACNLHNYCLNRDPGFFRHSWFLVDRFHWRNHSGCHIGYNMCQYPHLEWVNTQVAEQRNSTLRKLKASISYMNLGNFLNHCKLYVWFRNMVALANHHPSLRLKDISTFRQLACVYSKSTATNL